ncbi:MAG: hypothetical protein QXF88_00565 [Candidatus Aenigmatarchaeota archaeon]
MKKIALLAFLKSALAQPTGEIINVPVKESIEKLKSYSIFAGFVLSLVTIAFIVILYYIYRKRKLKGKKVSIKKSKKRIKK